jgi:hypothetical protein
MKKSILLKNYYINGCNTYYCLQICLKTELAYFNTTSSYLLDSPDLRFRLANLRSSFVAAQSSAPLLLLRFDESDQRVGQVTMMGSSEISPNKFHRLLEIIP